MIKEGYVEKVIYKNDDNGYAVFTVEGEDGEDIFVGTLHGISEGIYISAEGEYVNHPQYDLQFKFTSYEIKMPDDMVSVERYLGSGIIKGVGEALAKRIVKKFKMDSLRIIEEEPERLAEVKGISERKAREIAVSYNEKKEMQDAIIFLTGYGISINLAVKIFNEYGQEMYKIIRSNPYKIAEDISGVGFKTADEIAERMGISSDSDFRVICGQTETSYKKGTEIDLAELTGDADPVSLTIIPEKQGKLTVESLHKSEGAPSYRGKLQIKKQGNKYCIVNELAFEEYLYAVVSSEMPSSYEKEALKAQAVCARSYAVRRIQDGAFEEYGADLDDTTASQVYNNVFETEETIHAVQETEGQILTNDGDVVNAYFFSTSCGTTCRNDDVWGGEKLDYLNDQLEIYTEADRKRLGDATVMLDHGYFQIGDGRLSTEEVFRAFIDQTVYVNSIEKEEPFYRWQVTLTADQIQTLAGADITDQTGEIEKVRITKRGNSGIARNMVLYGKKSSVTIEGQMEIRELLCSPDVVIRKQDGSETSGFDLLPSAYFYITQDKEGNYQLHGGGFGHGVGMSQNGANDLAEAGYGYEEILSHYYNGTELEKLRETGNKTNEE